VLEGGSGAMVTIQEGKFVPRRFEDMLDPDTGRTRIRMVDVDTEYFKIARRYMLRLRRDDFDNPEVLEKLARTASLSVEEFKHQFQYVTATEAPPLRFVP